MNKGWYIRGLGQIEWEPASAGQRHWRSFSLKFQLTPTLYSDLLLVWTKSLNPYKKNSFSLPLNEKIVPPPPLPEIKPMFIWSGYLYWKMCKIYSSWNMVCLLSTNNSYWLEHKYQSNCILIPSADLIVNK